MRGLRFRIDWVMALVSIAAFDFAVIRTLIDDRSITGDLLLMRAVPMANVLAVGMLAGLRRLGSRSFLLGFEAFGVMALAVYLFLAVFFYRLPENYIVPVFNHLLRILRPYGILVWAPATWSAAGAMLLLPQVTFALIGGLLFRKFRITLTLR